MVFKNKVVKIHVKVQFCFYNIKKYIKYETCAKQMGVGGYRNAFRLSVSQSTRQ